MKRKGWSTSRSRFPRKAGNRFLSTAASRESADRFSDSNTQQTICLVAERFSRSISRPVTASAVFNSLLRNPISRIARSRPAFRCLRIRRSFLAREHFCRRTLPLSRGLRATHSTFSTPAKKIFLLVIPSARRSLPARRCPSSIASGLLLNSRASAFRTSSRGQVLRIRP